MVKNFKVGDLVRMEPVSEAFAALPAANSLVIVTNELPSSTRFFYGRVCYDNKEDHLWSYDRFFLISKAGR